MHRQSSHPWLPPIYPELSSAEMSQPPNDKDRSSIAVFVGAGAVENSWDPVYRALQKGNRAEISASNANLVLARMVHRLRWVTSNPLALDSADRKTIEEELQAKLSKMKSHICEELRNAEESGKLRLRPEFYSVYDL